MKEQNFLHVSQHWSAIRFIGGVKHSPPAELKTMSDVETIKGQPFDVRVKIDNNSKPSFGESVYSINEDQSLTYIGGDYDTSD